LSDFQVLCIIQAVKITYLQRIPYAEFDFTYARSRGPGGQHVNKTNSAVILRWNPMSSVAFNDLEKNTLSSKLNLTDAGDVFIRSEQFRSQEQNKSECLDKLENILQSAFFIPKKRYKTKPTRSSKRKRLEHKSHRAEIKQGRKRIADD